MGPCATLQVTHFVDWLPNPDPEERFQLGMIAGLACFWTMVLGLSKAKCGSRNLQRGFASRCILSFCAAVPESSGSSSEQGAGLYSHAITAADGAVGSLLFVCGFSTLRGMRYSFDHGRVAAAGAATTSADRSTTGH